MTELGFRLVARYGALAGSPIAAGPSAAGTSSTSSVSRTADRARVGGRQRRRPGRAVGATARRPRRRARESARSRARTRAGTSRGSDRAGTGGPRTFVATGPGTGWSYAPTSPAPSRRSRSPSRPTTWAPGGGAGALLDVEPQHGEIRLGSGTVRFVAGVRPGDRASPGNASQRRRRLAPVPSEDRTYAAAGVSLGPPRPSSVVSARPSSRPEPRASAPSPGSIRSTSAACSPPRWTRSGRRRSSPGTAARCGYAGPTWPRTASTT